MESPIQEINECLLHDPAANRSPFHYLFKRFLDLVLTIPGVLVITPLLSVIALWIKLDSTGPVFFRQVRVGRMGRSFQIYKFRTMVNHAETMGKHITVAGDHRITRAGRILRRLKLDELPQVFNVLKGEMSLVGPRPLVPEQVGEYTDAIRKQVLSVAPGMTGLASLVYFNESEILSKVKNPIEYYSQIILPTKVSFYLYYVHHFTIWMDLKIILATLLVLIPIKLNRKALSRLKVVREARHYAIVPDQDRPSQAGLTG